MRRNVKFLLHGELTSGLLICQNKHTVIVRVDPNGKPIVRRIKQHNVVVAPPGIEYPEDFKTLPKWYLSYLKFLETKGKRLSRSELIINKDAVVAENVQAIKNRMAEMLLARFEMASPHIRTI